MTETRRGPSGRGLRGPRQWPWLDRLGLGRLGLAGAGLAGLGLTWHVIVLAGLSLDRSPTAAAGSWNLEQLSWFWASAAVGWGGLTLLWIGLSRAASSQRIAVGPASWRAPVLIIIFTIAIAARAAVIFTHAPCLSDDIHRYELDGRTLAHGHSPYMQSPAERQSQIMSGSEERWPGELMLLTRINNEAMHTIYLPMSQLVFAGIGMAMGDAELSVDDATRPFRATFVIFELLAIVCIALLLWSRGRSPWWLTLYAWHPLAVSEIAGSGHQDAVGIALLAVALLISCSTSRSTGTAGTRSSALLSMIPLALGALVKPVLVPVAAIVLRGRPARDWVFSALLGGGLCLAMCGPMLLIHDAQPLKNLSESAERFASKWSHFSGVYEPVLAISKVISPIEDEQVQWQKKERHERIARLVCLAMLLGIFIMLMRRSQRDVPAAVRMLLFAMVLLSTTAHPWYVLWALLLMPVVPSAALWIASLTLTLGYAALAQPATWEIPAWVFIAGYGPVFAALAWSALQRQQ